MLAMTYSVSGHLDGLNGVPLPRDVKIPTGLQVINVREQPTGPELEITAPSWTFRRPYLMAGIGAAGGFVLGAVLGGLLRRRR